MGSHPVHTSKGVSNLSTCLCRRTIGCFVLQYSRFACFTTLAPCSSNLLGMLPIIQYDIEAGETVHGIGMTIWETPRYGNKRYRRWHVRTKLMILIGASTLSLAVVHSHPDFDGFQVGQLPVAQMNPRGPRHFPSMRLTTTVTHPPHGP